MRQPTRRWLGNKLITLAYQIEPKLNTELNQHVQSLLDQQAAIAAKQATIRLLEHQQHAAQIAARQ